jgi:hypothetical protein
LDQFGWGEETEKMLLKRDQRGFKSFMYPGNFTLIEKIADCNPVAYQVQIPRPITNFCELKNE